MLFILIPNAKSANFYPTRVRSLATLVTHSLTSWLTSWRLVDFIDMTLGCEVASSKLVEVVTVDEDIRIVLATVCCRFGNWGFILKLDFAQTLSTRFSKDFELKFRQYFEAGVWIVFCRWCFVEVMKLVEFLKLGLVNVLNFKMFNDNQFYLTELVGRTVSMVFTVLSDT